MTATDQVKVMQSGFTIIRRNYKELHIKYKNRENLHWKILRSNIASKSALDREMKKLLDISTIIED